MFTEQILSPNSKIFCHLYFEEIFKNSFIWAFLLTMPCIISLQKLYWVKRHLNNAYNAYINIYFCQAFGYSFLAIIAQWNRPKPHQFNWSDTIKFFWCNITNIYYTLYYINKWYITEYMLFKCSIVIIISNIPGRLSTRFCTTAMGICVHWGGKASVRSGIDVRWGVLGYSCISVHPKGV